MCIRDSDNDGWEDIYVVNDSRFAPATNKLFRNLGDGTFSLISEMTPLSSFFAGRGGTWADFNNDGALDIVVANNEADIGVQIFQNTNNENNWIAFDVEGTTVSLDAYGTRIQVQTAQGVKIDEKACGMSYASQSSHRLYFGLGQGEAQDILVTWPDGSQDFFDELEINQIHFIKQGSNPFVAAVDSDMDGFNSDEDCDDTNAEVNPMQTEVPYNGLDDDCDDTTLDDDLDQDGYGFAEDCDDTNASINPLATEIPNNGIDEDCDGADSTSANENLVRNGLKIYPNPITDYLVLEFEEPTDATIQILNIQGQLINESRIEGNNKLTVDARPLTSGIYILKIQEGLSIGSQLLTVF